MSAIVARTPTRTCVGCRLRAPQAQLARFVRSGERWLPDIARARSPGRGVYLCSERCAVRALKNKRYPGLGAAAASAGWRTGERLCVDGTGVYDSTVPPARDGRRERQRTTRHAPEQIT